MSWWLTYMRLPGTPATGVTINLERTKKQILETFWSFAQNYAIYS
jgi:hypothetical protein